MASEENENNEKRRQEILKQMGLDNESVHASIEEMLKSEARSNWASRVGIVFALITASAAFYFTLSSDIFRFHLNKRDDLVLAVQKQQEQLAELEAIISQMQTNVVAVTNRESAQIARSVADHEKRIKTIEDVILENPEKAMSLPLIRQEQKQLDDSLVSLKREVEQSSETLRWAFGLILTTALTIAGIFAGIISKNRNDEADLRVKLLSTKGK